MDGILHLGTTLCWLHKAQQMHAIAAPDTHTPLKAATGFNLWTAAPMTAPNRLLAKPPHAPARLKAVNKVKALCISDSSY